ncbi:MAG: cell wall metabolism sensor histidine kinase WalK [Streptococcaceae bacterium]|jgi:two-component system sensor histidine kinase VicK|nr:cell wall metabolism sensor histidine kinase WalK [Streptococcaceae bacterium]
MKNKIRFWQSMNFRIAATFVVLLLFSVGAIGLYFISALNQFNIEIKNITTFFLTFIILFGVVALLVALLIARSITKPLEEIRKAALQISKGDYSNKIQVHGNDEISQLAGTFNELSDRIESTQESMESERNRLNSVLAHMTDGVIATDRRGKVITINEMALSQLNLESDQVLGSSILDILKISSTFSLRRILEENPTILVEVENELDEEPSVLHVEFSMIRRESGFISGLVAVFHDVTESSKTERERQQFVSSVSHELRTPLTSMRSYLEALIDGAWQDPEIAPNFLGVTLKETERMIRMINDLLSLSRMDSGVVALQKEFVNYNNFLNFILDRFDMIAKEKNLDGKRFVIKRQFTKKDLWVELDTDKLTQVIDNIMNNAMKYSPDGGQITVRLMDTHSNVILSITDQGLGIPRKDLAKIFERFYRVDKARARAQGGTGLGLSIAKDIVKAHGGQIWAESQEGRGSTFLIALPYEPYEDEEWE